MAVATQPMTADELLRLPRGIWRYELRRGELSRMSPAGHRHGRVAARVTARLFSFVDEHELGEVYAAETGFLIARDPDTVRAPDVAFVARERQPAVAAEGYFPGPPDLAVEVVSPSDGAGDVEAKVAEWIAAGVRAVVTLDPLRRTAAVDRRGAAVQALEPGATLSVPELVPGWSLRLADVFR